MSPSPCVSAFLYGCLYIPGIRRSDQMVDGTQLRRRVDIHSTMHRFPFSEDGETLHT